MISPLVLLGDLAPVGLGRLTADALMELAAGSLTIANLETPLCGPNVSPRPKAGPVLRGEASVLQDLAAWPGLVLTHANNHAMDFDTAGLAATQAATAAAGITLIGAGVAEMAAAEPHIVTHNGVRVAIVGATEPWFGVATPTRPGVHALQPGLFARLRQLRDNVDRLIISVHGGNEMSAWPSPRWQQTMRALAESGADIVHAHHPHVTQGWEQWQGRWIFYGLGNTIVNPGIWAKNIRTRQSLCVRLDLADLSRGPEVTAWECQASGAIPDQASLVALEGPDQPEMLAHQQPLSDRIVLTGLHQEYSLRIWESLYGDRLGMGDTLMRRIRLVARSSRDSALSLGSPSRGRRLQRDRALFHYHLFASPGHADEIATVLGLMSGETEDHRSSATRLLAERWLPTGLFRS